MKYSAPAIVSTRKANTVLGTSKIASFTGLKGDGAEDSPASQTDSSAYTANS